MTGSRGVGGGARLARDGDAAAAVVAAVDDVQLPRRNMQCRLHALVSPGAQEMGM